MTAALAATAAAQAGAHANSVSHAIYTVERDALHAVVRLPLDDVDLLLRLDRDLDGEVSDAERDRSAAPIRAYLARHLRVMADAAPLDPAPGRVASWRDASGFRYLECEWSFRTPAGASRLSIHTDFLAELYPSHQTLGRITAAGREERFTFDSHTTYQRRIGGDRINGIAAVAGALVVVGGLIALRRRSAAAVVAILLVTAPLRADVILSAPGLNATLKTLEKLKRQTEGNAAAERQEAWFQLGSEADGLASILNLEVESHGMQERELLDLALERTKELGVVIAYHRDKKKFFYDGAAFAEYLKAAPRGRHAAAAEFKLLSYRFYQSSASDIASLTAAADDKRRFLARYPAFAAAAEVRLFLAVDYRDLYRKALDEKQAADAARWRRLARAECVLIASRYPRTEQADAARQLLRGLEGR